MNFMVFTFVQGNLQKYVYIESTLEIEVNVRLKFVISY